MSSAVDPHVRERSGILEETGYLPIYRVVLERLGGVLGGKLGLKCVNLGSRQRINV